MCVKVGWNNIHGLIKQREGREQIIPRSMEFDGHTELEAKGKGPEWKEREAGRSAAGEGVGGVTLQLSEHFEEKGGGGVEPKHLRGIDQIRGKGPTDQGGGNLRTVTLDQPNTAGPEVGTILREIWQFIGGGTGKGG